MSLATQRHVALVMARPGTRLALATIAPLLGVTYGEIGRALGITTSAASNLARYNAWPRRMDREVAAGFIRDVLASRGATSEQLAMLFVEEPLAGRPRRTAGTRPDPRRPARSSFVGPVASAKHEDASVLIAKSFMTPATTRHFKLFCNPFGPVERDEQFFVSNEVAYLQELLSQCVAASGFMALIGESGAGKTTLLNDLEDRVLRNGRGGVVLFKPSTVGMEESDRTGHMLKSTDLLHSIISTLDSGASMPVSLQARTLLAVRLMTASVRAGHSHLLAVEEAHRMPESTLRHLKRLHELREGRKPLLGILLLAQPELDRRLADGLRSGTLREVAQRCEVATLPPLGDDLQSYLECRTRACGRELASIVELAAVPAIAEKLTAKVGQQRIPMSYPLAVNNVVTRAMNLAAEIGAPLVTSDVVRAT